MSQPAVVFDHVWKKFRRGERHDSLRDLVPSMVKRFAGRGQLANLTGDQEFWAVEDVSFEVQPGEAVGIIGPNGAGKSTSLKLLTRILRPTRGRCHVRGRVGALIEVAAGFHPDLTGRENVFLQGAIMGMKRAEIASRLEEIVEFSGISAFIDTPVKRYSSGMQARLGFSVAAHLDPDVLFVDEVLSVGDMSFQAKCLDRMRQNVRAGVTLVFVSHNLQAVAFLCKRAIVCAKGRLLFDGPTEDALDVYMKAAQTASTRFGSQQQFKLLSAEFVGAGANGVERHRKCRLTVDLECLQDIDACTVGIEVERTRDLFYCYGAAGEDLGMPLWSARAGERLRISLEFTAHLTRGHYRVNLNIRQPRSASFAFFGESVANFSIAEQESYDGVVDIEPRITLDRNVADAHHVLSATVA